MFLTSILVFMWVTYVSLARGYETTLRAAIIGLLFGVGAVGWELRGNTPVSKETAALYVGLLLGVLFVFPGAEAMFFSIVFTATVFLGLGAIIFTRWRGNPDTPRIIRR